MKIHAVKGRRIIPLDQEDVLSGQWEVQLQSLPPDESMPSISIWRPNGMKIFISDLLYPGEPDNLLETMASLKGMSVILAPTLQEEAELPAGNARLKTVNPATCAASSSPLPCPGGTPAPTPPILNSGFLPACAARPFLPASPARGR